MNKANIGYLHYNDNIIQSSCNKSKTKVRSSFPQNGFDNSGCLVKARSLTVTKLLVKLSTFSLCQLQETKFYVFVCSCRRASMMLFPRIPDTLFFVARARTFNEPFSRSFSLTATLFPLRRLPWENPCVVDAAHTKVLVVCMVDRIFLCCRSGPSGGRDEMQQCISCNGWCCGTKRDELFSKFSKLRMQHNSRRQLSLLVTSMLLKATQLHEFWNLARTLKKKFLISHELQS